VNDALCGVISDYVLVRNDLAVPGSVNGGGTVCSGASGTLSLTGFTPTATIIRWERSNDNFQSNIVQLNNTTPVYTYSNLTETSQFRAVVELSGTCPSVHSMHATVVVREDAPAQASPSLQTVCGTTAVLTGVVPVSGTGVWSFESGPASATVVTNVGMGMVSGMSAEGDYVFRWTVTNSPCPVRYKEVVVRKKAGVSMANAGANQRVCGSTATLVGNNPSNGVGTWRLVGGPSPAFVTTVGVQGLVTGMDLPGDYEFEWEILENICNERSTSRMIVTRVSEPTQAFAGSHQEVCTSTTTLVGNMPVNGTGSWSFVSGPTIPSLLPSGNLATVVNMDVEGEYVFRYTISNSPCASSFSEVRVRKVGDPGQAQVFNTNVNACSNQFTLQAVRPNSGTGVWEFLSGPAPAVIFTNGTNGLIDGMTLEGEYIFRWTIGNANCGTSSVNVSVWRHAPIFPASFAGTNQRICDRGTALLSGSQPPQNGRGVWAFVSGPVVPSLNQFGNFASVVNMDVAGDYVFSWTVENGICPPSVSYVTVTRVAPPTVAQAGPSGTICGTSAVLRGNIPTVGTGSWSIVQSAGGNPSLSFQGENATLSNVTVAGTYIIRYTISNAPCSPSHSDVVLVFNPMSAGGNLTANNSNVCAGNNAGTLSVSGQMGNIIRWEVSEDDFNSLTIDPRTTPSLTFSNLTRSTSYRVVVKQGTCAEAVSNVVKITVNPMPVSANAGNDVQLCGDNVVLSGNDPMGSTGVWSLVSTPLNTPNPGMTPSGRDLVVSGLRSGDYVFRWTISNSCGSTNDDVVVSVSEGTQAGILGTDASVCSGSNTGVLSLSGHRGTVVRWEMSTNNWATVMLNPTTATTFNYNNLTQTTSYRVVVRDGFCGELTSNEVRISVVTPVVSNAGMNQTICGSRITLNGNDPGVGNVGTWSQVSGAPSMLSQSGRRLDVSGLVPGVYRYKWTISFGGVCPASESEVEVTVGTGSLGGEVTSNATVCGGTNSGTLNLINHQGNVLRWERSTNNWNTVIVLPFTTTTLSYTNLTQTTRFRAVVQANGCSAATSLEAVIRVDQPGVAANAGSDQVICGNTATVLGNDPGTGIGTWRLVSGSPLTVINGSGRLATVSNLQTGVTELEYEIDRGACGKTSDRMLITVDERSNAGFMTGGGTFCNTASTTLTLTAYTGTIVRWESSTDNFVTVQPISHQLPNLTVSNVTRTTAYRAVLSGGVCGQSMSNAVVVEVLDGNYVADAGLNRVICGSEITLSGNTPGGLVGSWTLLMAPTQASPSLLTNGNVLSVSNMNVSGDYIFRYTLQRGNCAPSTADVMVTVTGVTVAGSLTASPSAVCEGMNSGTITLNGNTGTVVRWELSTDNWVTVLTDNVTTPTYNYTNLTVSTAYRAVVQNGNCGMATTTPVVVNVDRMTIGGEVTANATVCSGNNAGTMQLSGHRGMILRWEWSLDANGPWTAIGNNSPSQSYLNLTQTTFYRAVVKNGSCAEMNSGSVMIMVTNGSVGGTLAGGGTVCAGTNSATFTLSGHAGTIVRWERSTDMNFGLNVTAIPNPGNVLTLTNVSEDTYVRVLVKNGSCAAAYSTVGVVIVNQPGNAGTLVGAATVCTGVNSGVITLSGQTGNVVRWEESSDCQNFTNVNNQTLSLSYTNLTQSMCYRAVVVNGACPEVKSNVVRIEVNALSVGGVATGAATVCRGSNSGTISVSGQVGNVTGWESSTDCQTFSPINNTPNSILLYNNLVTTMCYRAVIRNGVCSEAYSSPVRIEVLPGTEPGVITGNVGACSGNASGTLTLTGNNAPVVRWEASVNGGGFVPVQTGGTTFNYNNLTQSTRYRVVVQQGNCAAVTGPEVEVSVTGPTVSGVLSGNATVCGGMNTGSILLSGNVGNIVRWEMSENGNPFTVAPGGVNNPYVYQNLTVTTQFRAVVRNGVCAEATTNAVTIAVSSPLVLNAGSTTGCTNAGTITAQASGGNGGYVYSIIPAIQNPNNTGVFSNVPTGNYTIVVRDNIGCEASRTVFVSPVATPPNVLSVTNVTTSSGIVSWGSVSGAISYNLRYKVLGEPNWTLITGIGGTSRFLSGLQNNTTYEVEVQYVCSGGLVSGFSSGLIRTFTTLPMGTGDCATSGPSNVPVPGGIYVHNVNNTSAQVSWNPVLNTQGYIVSYGLSNVNPNTWTQVVVCHPTTTFLMTNLQPNTSYRVRIRTNCSNCITALNNNDLRSVWSNEFGFNTPGNRMELNEAVGLGISVYPNPTKGEFVVDLSESVSGNAVLYDALGREVLRENVNGNSLVFHIDHLSSGIYTLKLTVGNDVKTVKVVRE
jgi:hypothetical protein